MNFLAHIYLSGEDPQIQLGNFMADAVKGKQFDSFTPGVTTGILLHRFIDSYTDAHSIFRQSRRRLYGKQFGHYSGVIIDMFYDHFLASNWSQFHELSLDTFAQKFYKNISQNRAMTPDKTQRMIPYMIDQNWLIQYQSLEGLNIILSQMNRRTKWRSNMDQATQALKQDYDLYQAEFFEFFDRLKIEAAKELRRLTLERKK